MKVSAETLAVVERALYFGEISDGSFDPTILPVLRLWGFGGPKYRVPGDDELKATLTLVDYRKVHVNKAESTVYLEESGMGIELGAIAKGYAVDSMADIMRTRGYFVHHKRRGKRLRRGREARHDPVERGSH